MVGSVPPSFRASALAVLRLIAPSAKTGREQVQQKPSLDHLVRTREHVGGRSRPIAFAVFRLMTSSNLVGCMEDGVDANPKPLDEHSVTEPVQRA